MIRLDKNYSRAYGCRVDTRIIFIVYEDLTPISNNFLLFIIIANALFCMTNSQNKSVNSNSTR